MKLNLKDLGFNTDDVYNELYGGSTPAPEASAPDASAPSDAFDLEKEPNSVLKSGGYTAKDFNESRLPDVQASMSAASDHVVAAPKPSMPVDPEFEAAVRGRIAGKGRDQIVNATAKAGDAMLKGAGLHQVGNWQSGDTVLKPLDMGDAPKPTSTYEDIGEQQIADIKARRANALQKQTVQEDMDFRNRSLDKNSDLSESARRLLVLMGVPQELIKGDETHADLVKQFPMLKEVVGYQEKQQTIKAAKELAQRKLDYEMKGLESRREGLNAWIRSHPDTAITPEMVSNAKNAEAINDLYKQQAAEATKVQQAEVNQDRKTTIGLTAQNTKLHGDTVKQGAQRLELDVNERSMPASGNWEPVEPGNKTPFVNGAAKNEFTKLEAGVDAAKNHSKAVKAAWGKWNSIDGILHPLDKKQALNEVNQQMGFLISKVRAAEGIPNTDSSQSSVEASFGVHGGTSLTPENWLNPDNLPQLLDSSIEGSNANLDSTAKANGIKRKEKAASANSDTKKLSNGKLVRKNPSAPGGWEEVK
jgi:hypothetical protein